MIHNRTDTEDLHDFELSSPFTKEDNENLFEIISIEEKKGENAPIGMKEIGFEIDPSEAFISPIKPTKNELENVVVSELLNEIDEAEVPYFLEKLEKDQETHLKEFENQQITLANKKKKFHSHLFSSLKEEHQKRKEEEKKKGFDAILRSQLAEKRTQSQQEKLETNTKSLDLLKITSKEELLRRICKEHNNRFEYETTMKIDNLKKFEERVEMTEQEAIKKNRKKERSIQNSKKLLVMTSIKEHQKRKIFETIKIRKNEEKRIGEEERSLVHRTKKNEEKRRDLCKTMIQSFRKELEKRRIEEEILRISETDMARKREELIKRENELKRIEIDLRIQTARTEKRKIAINRIKLEHQLRKETENLRRKEFTIITNLKFLENATKMKQDAKNKSFGRLWNFTKNEMSSRRIEEEIERFKSIEKKKEKKEKEMKIESQEKIKELRNWKFSLVQILKEQKLRKYDEEKRRKPKFYTQFKKNVYSGAFEVVADEIRSANVKNLGGKKFRDLKKRRRMQNKQFLREYRMNTSFTLVSKEEEKDLREKLSSSHSYSNHRRQNTFAGNKELEKYKLFVDIKSPVRKKKKKRKRKPKKKRTYDAVNNFQSGWSRGYIPTKDEQYTMMYMSIVSFLQNQKKRPVNEQQEIEKEEKEREERIKNGKGKYEAIFAQIIFFFGLFFPCFQLINLLCFSNSVNKKAVCITIASLMHLILIFSILTFFIVIAFFVILYIIM